MPFQKGKKRAAGAGRKRGVPNKATFEIKAAALLEAPDALAVAVEIMNDEAVPPAVRLNAAEWIIDRACGKVPQAVELNQKTDERNPADDLTDDEADAELIAAADEARERQATKAARAAKP